MLKEVAVALISSACVGLATIAGTVLVHTDNIDDLEEDISELIDKLDQHTNKIHRLEIEIAVLDGRISRESARRLSSLSNEEINQLGSALQSTELTVDSEIETSSSEELLSNEDLPSELKTIIESHQLTGTDLQNLKSLESTQ